MSAVCWSLHLHGFALIIHAQQDGIARRQHAVAVVLLVLTQVLLERVVGLLPMLLARFKTVK
jgi:hypothetical protein